MSRDRNPKNMKELLKITAGLSSDSANSNNQESAHGGCGDADSLAQRQKFLSEALDHATTSETDTIKTFLAIIPTLPNTAISKRSSTTIEYFVQYYELRIVDIIVDIDSANLFYQLGGLTALLPLIDHEFEELRYVAIDAIRICCGNNPFCQGLSTIEEILRPLILNTKTNVSLKIREKTLSCMSALLRNNMAAVLEFKKFGGFESLRESLTFAPGKEKLNLRSLFVVKALIDTDPRSFEGLMSVGIIEILRNILVKAEDLELLEDTLGTLLHLLNLFKPARKVAQQLKLKAICFSVGQQMINAHDDAYELGVKFAADIDTLLD